MITTTLVNSMLAYMSLFHFEEAMKCADLILDTYIKDAEIYYRKAQVSYCTIKKETDKALSCHVSL